MEISEKKYWVAISQFTKIGAVKFKKIYNYFPSMEAAYKASFNDLMRTGLEEKIVQEFISKRSEINPDEEWEKLEKENISVLTIKDENYPKILKEIYNPPALLYYKGKIFEKEEFSLAVVGTRKITPYGRQVTPQIVNELVKNNLTIVSGLALGIDSLAHETTVKNSGRTIAVLGSGLDKQNIYPAHNRYLVEKIIEQGGLVISEYPIGMLPLKYNFPARNRIISGLSLGTLVIEAGENSGALITAKYALEQNREVFAIPGSIYSQSSFGPNNLIKLGAKPVVSTEDILEALNLNQATNFIANQKIVPESKEEETLLRFLSKEPVHVDKLVQESKLSASAVNSTLTMMEMKGKVKNLGNMNYVLSR